MILCANCSFRQRQRACRHEEIEVIDMFKIRSSTIFSYRLRQNSDCLACAATSNGDHGLRAVLCCGGSLHALRHCIYVGVCVIFAGHDASFQIVILS